MAKNKKTKPTVKKHSRGDKHSLQISIPRICHGLNGILQKDVSTGVPWWHSKLRTQHCQYCGMSLIPGLGTSACRRRSQKKKKKKNENQNRCIHILHPETVRVILLGKKDICRHAVKILEMSSSWIIQVDPKSNDWCPSKRHTEEKAHRQSRRRCDHGEACGSPEATRSWDRQEMERSMGRSAVHQHLDFSPAILTASSSHPACGPWLQQPQETHSP